MTLLQVILQVVVVVAILHVIGLYTLAPIQDVRSTLRDARKNARHVAPTALILGIVLVANSLIWEAGVQLSWFIGVNITGSIHAVEGRFVATVQSFATPELTILFSIQPIVKYMLSF
ncbi:hypothetical protein [Haloarcula sp. 1CSR25-25]|uniref:hypothetical protein n=1 Tax=Haloarcula sp. 1CSR25-25 TaxID=2862545 RepID=UPI0028956FF4|nr:hypothetical protein [Haloarcula sp. 1CSR25-25]MDT3437426.1 hypothetical protein [Haloarcula sp. 1CSR25-25]